MKALVVDDDLALADVLSFTLRRAGFEVIAAHDGFTALERWQTENPDIVILDWNLPRLNGLTVCQRIRSQADTPIIILSVRNEEDDIVDVLHVGADDYIVKPFSPRQLVARVEAVMRRSGASHPSPEPLGFGDLHLNLSRREIHYQGIFISRLTPLECRFMETIMINPSQVIPYDTFIDHLWGSGGGDRGMLKQLVYRLRRKFESLPEGTAIIETVQELGYTLKS